MEVEMPKRQFERIDFKVIGICEWRLHEAEAEIETAVFTEFPTAKPFELLFYLACQQDMQAPRDKILREFWRDAPTHADKTLKTWMSQLIIGNTPGGAEWEGVYPIESRSNFIRLKDGCSSDMQAFWRVYAEAEQEADPRKRKAKIDWIRYHRLQLLPRSTWHWAGLLKAETLRMLQELEKTIPSVLPEEDLPSYGEFPGNLSYPGNPFFQGREGVLEKLRMRLSGTDQGRHIQALCALGGMGKTETAVEYAYRCFREYSGYPHYNRVLWARADDEDTLANAFADMARFLPDFPFRDEKDRDLLVSTVHNWLTDSRHRGWLLILDNADQPGILRKFLIDYRDRLQGHVIITSRSQKFSGLTDPNNHQLLDPLLVEESLAFLYDRTGRDQSDEEERQSARDIAVELDGLPLALEQATAYLNQNPSLRFGEYLKLYHSSRHRMEIWKAHEEMRPYTGGPEKEHLTVWTTWDLNFQEVARIYPPSADLLKMVACLASAPIPIEIVYKACPVEFEDAEGDADRIVVYERLLTPLRNYSLVRSQDTERTFSMHALVQEIAKAKLLPEDLKRTFACTFAAVTNAFSQSNDFFQERAMLFAPHLEILREALEQNQYRVGEVGLLYSQIGGLLFHQGRLTEAETIHLMALDQRRREIPEESPEITEIISNLGVLYSELEHLTEAENLLNEALQRLNIAPSKDDLVIAQCVNNLGVVYMKQRRADSMARSYLERALEIRQKTKDAKPSQIVESLINMGGLCMQEENSAEAEIYLQKALGIMRETLPGAHLEISTALNNLGLLKLKQERYEEAAAFYLEAVETLQNSAVPKYLKLAIFRFNLGFAYEKLEWYTEAISLYSLAVETLAPMVPSDHRYLLWFRSNLERLLVLLTPPEAPV